MLWALIIVFIASADQLSKYYISKNVGFGDMIPIIDKFFYLTFHGNSGAAWGILQNGRYFFIALTFVMLIVLCYYLYKMDSRLLKISLSLIIGGALGNLIDRVAKGEVSDFLDFYIGSYHFPTFNVADMSIVIGTFLLAYFLLFVYKSKSEDKV